MFFDHAKIHVAAGDGGNGCISFRREKHVPRGGPDGGDGGRGGNVVLVADPQARDLQAFTYKVHFKAESGGAGQGARKHGARGADAVIKVPLGTQVLADEGLLADIVNPRDEVLMAHGGTGGRGNARFVNSIRQAPKFAELGEPGESMWLELSLKLMADAGLAGLPNAGKSSLLRRLSNAKPKVANYPFTTLEPMLGIVDWSGEGDVFTLADVPGLLEGASEGVGLGHEFLGHLERCQLILHVVDASGYYGVDPIAGFRTILGELDAHGSGLGMRPQVILLNKIDAVEAQVVEELAGLVRSEVERLRAGGHPAFSYLLGGTAPGAAELVWPVSAVTGAGLTAFVRWVGPLVDVLTAGARARLMTEAGGKTVEPHAAEALLVRETGMHGVYRPLGANAKLFVVEKTPLGFAVRGKAVRRLVSRFDLTNEEAIRYLGERLERLGVYAALRAQGAVPGDDVDIEGYDFEFQ
ncbi:MAG: GTPase ObgE [Actinobacteria bacterium]|nr:GTPase ObgE [Actinomycetota bacterium]